MQEHSLKGIEDTEATLRARLAAAEAERDEANAAWQTAHNAEVDASRRAEIAELENFKLATSIGEIESARLAAEADSKRHLVQAGVWAAKAGLIQGKLDVAEAALSEARAIANDLTEQAYESTTQGGVFFDTLSALRATLSRPATETTLIPAPRYDAVYWDAMALVDGHCPQVGNGGNHSDSYYEGEPCVWCGAQPATETTEAQTGHNLP